MERLTPQQRLQIVQLYYKNGRSVKSVYRALRPIYGVHNRPTERTIRHIIGKLENNLTLLDDTRSIRSRETMDLLRNRFGEQFISRLGPVDWPPRLCDITPLDFYLWGYVKSKCFVGKPATIEALEVNITEVISEIPTEVLE